MGSLVSAGSNFNCSANKDISDYILSVKIPDGWDYVVLTASNEAQALSYRNQIEYRLDAGLLQKNTKYIVVPDVDGKRIGSGGATFNVLRFIRETSDEEDCFSGKRILVIHSGGESSRVPQYASSGKLFAPVQREIKKGVSATLFDEIIASVKALPSSCPAGMLTVAGDIVLVFDPCEVDLKACDAAALSVYTNISQGENHGVFIPDSKGDVKRFLHKLPVEQLQEFGAQGMNGKIHIDTGVIWFCSKIIKVMFDLIGNGKKIDRDRFETFANENERLSFYTDLVYPIASESRLEQYLKEKPEGNYTKKLAFCRKTLFWKLHGYKMKLIELTNAEFIHFGTTSELLELMTAGIEKYPSLSWVSSVNSTGKTSGIFSANGSYIDENSTVGEGSYIEKSCLYNSTVGKRCVVSNIILDSVTIPDDTVVHCLRQNDGDYVVRIFGVKDDPKRGYNDGGKFLGNLIRDFMQAHKLSVADLWNCEPYSLWNAKLFCKSDSVQISLECALNLSAGSARFCDIGQRVSMKQSSDDADTSYI